MIDFKVGQEYRAFYCKDSPKNRLIMIKAIIDKDYIAFRWYSKNKRLFVYEIKHRSSKSMSEDILTLVEE